MINEKRFHMLVPVQHLKINKYTASEWLDITMFPIEQGNNF